MDETAATVHIGSAPEAQLGEIVEALARMDGIESMPISRCGGAAPSPKVREFQNRLADLGYMELPEDESKEGIFDKKTEEATRKFQAEAMSAPNPGVLDEATWLRMARFYECDDVPMLKGRLVPGDQGIWVRTAQFRLRQIGLYHQAVTGIFDDATLNGVRLFSALQKEGEMKDAVDPELWKILHDPYGLTRLIYDRLKGRGIVIPLEANGFTVQSAEETVLENGWFVDKTLTDFPSRLEYQSRLLTPAKMLNHLEIPFAVHLIQLRLWMAGYDTGLRDGWAGRRTFAALAAFLQDEDIALQKAVRRLNETEGVVAPAVFEHLGFQPPTQEDIENLEKAILDTAMGEAEALKEERLDPSKRPLGFFANLWDSIRDGTRRIWNGIREGIVRAGRAIRRGVGTAIHWVWSRLVKIGAVGLNALKVVFRRLRHITQVLSRSIKDFTDWVAGGRIIFTGDSQARIITRIRLDSDMVTLMESSSSSEKVINRHIRTLRRRSLAILTAARIVGIALGVLVKLPSGPILWPLLAIRLLHALRDGTKHFLELELSPA